MHELKKCCKKLGMLRKHLHTRPPPLAEIFNFQRCKHSLFHSKFITEKFIAHKKEIPLNGAQHSSVARACKRSPAAFSTHFTCTRCGNNDDEMTIKCSASSHINYSPPHTIPILHAHNFIMLPLTKKKVKA